MRSSEPPRLATLLLERFGPSDEALIGDVIEGYRTGRSALWYWRQVVSAVLVGTSDAVRRQPLLAVRAVLVGWATALAVFFLFGDLTSPLFNSWLRKPVEWTGVEGIARTRLMAVTFVPVMTVGFVLSGWMVRRFASFERGAMVVIYAASVVAALGVWELIFELILWRPTPVPHTFFYAIFTVLPYLGRVGFVVVPFLILVGGIIGAPSRLSPEARAKRSIGRHIAAR
jgi:hypothetical protein